MRLFSRKPKEIQSGETLAYAVVDGQGVVQYMSDGIENCHNVVLNSERQGTKDLVIRRIAYRFLEGKITAGWVQS